MEGDLAKAGRLSGICLLLPRKEVNEMALVRWTPYKELLDMPREMTSLFGHPFRSLLGEPFFGLDTKRVPMDIYSKGRGHVCQAGASGIKAEDVDITLAEHTLTITGERHEDKEIKEDDFYRRGAHLRQLERTLPLPETVTEKDIEATFEDGVLELTVKRRDRFRTSQAIEVKAEGKSAGRYRGQERITE